MIDRQTLFHLPTFLAVADTGSFTAAAARLRVGVSAVSEAVRALEERLGQPLFLRSTRKVALTEQGQALRAKAQPLLRELGLAIEQTQHAGGPITGTLRLNVPRIAFPLVLDPVLPAMRARHPGLTIEVFVEDASTDIIANGFDAGIRLGSMAELDMIAVRLTPVMTGILVASPAYLARKGRPAAIGDLAAHDLIAFRMGRSGRVYDWELTVGDEIVEVPMKGPLIVNDTIFNLTLALSGHGIAYLFDALAAPYIADGLLEQLLPQHATAEAPLLLYFPRYASEQPKLRAFIEVARDVLTPNGLQ